MAQFGPPDLSASINQGVEAITGGIQNYQLGQELANLPRTADGSPDFQAAALRLMRTNPAAAQRMMALEEMKQRRTYQDRYLANQERQTDIAADKSTTVQAEGKIFHIGSKGELKGTTDVETGVFTPAAGGAPATPQQQQRPASPAGTGVGKQPSPDHLQKLQADPSLAPMFDEVYGPGSAQRYLSGGGPADPREQPPAPAAAAPAAPAAPAAKPASTAAPILQPPPGLSYSQRKAWMENRIKEQSGVNDAELKKADDNIQSGRNTLITIGEMQKLSETAFDKPTAGIRGTIAGITGIGGKQAGIDTTVLQNKITGGALEQLRATFGGNPTEGERAILLQVQGSVSQPKGVRDQIFKDAADLVRRRIKFNQKYANAQRAGQYMDPNFTDNTPVD